VEKVDMNQLIVVPETGPIVELGVITMRLLASSEQTNGAFSLAEFRGAEGPWTVRHVHRGLEESFYVLDGSFEFTCGNERIEAATGAFLVVPRGKPHVLRAGEGGGMLLTMWTPGGLEQMFLELGRLPVESVTDPDVRRGLSERFDSTPV
jgi:quercetin dioxygenase-like cupin family protein